MSIDQTHVSRRTIAKGAAWSVPAVAVAAAAPSLAASTTAPHDLSTSVPGGGTRTSDLNLNLAATNFINTGSETVQGLTVTFQVDSGQTIEAIQIFGNDIKNLAVGSTTSGYGTDTVVLTLAPGSELGQVTIEPGGSYQAPLGQDLVLSSPDAFTISVTVMASNGTAESIPFATSEFVPAL